MQPTPVFLPGESHGQRSLGGYSPPVRKESDMTERLTFIYDIQGVKMTKTLPDRHQMNILALGGKCKEIIY